MNEKTCKLWFNHRLTKESTEDAKGREFRYVKSCRCGKHVEKSIPYHENDLLGNIAISSNNFEVDQELSVIP